MLIFAIEKKLLNKKKINLLLKYIFLFSKGNGY